MNPLPFFFQPFLAQRDRWFLWVPVFMAGGAALFFALPFEPSVLCLAATPLLLCGFLLSRGRPLLFLCLAALLASTAGFNAAQLETRLSAAPMLEEKISSASITGTLTRADILPEGARLVIKDPFIPALSPEETPRFIRFKTRAAYATLPEAGTRISVWGPLWPPGEPVVPDGYDFRRTAFFRQWGATGFSYGSIQTREAKKDAPFFWDGFFLSFEKARRALSLTTYEKLPAPEAAMTAALLTGNQTGIDEDVMDAMRLSGLSHLLSISGVHVGMIAFLLYAPLRALLALFPFLALRLPVKKIAAVFSIFGTILYAIFVGADAPTIRSALMSGLVLCAVLADRKTLSLRLVALAALLVLLAAPSGVIGPSFQMSFAAVLAMVAAYEKRLDKPAASLQQTALPAPVRVILRSGKDIILTSLIATAATTPFTLFHFQNLSFYGVAANMLAIPLTTLWVMPCLLLTYLAAPLGLEALPLAGAGWGVDLTIKIAQNVASWPYARLVLPPMPLWAFGGFVLGGLWLCLWRGRLRLIGLLPVLLACLFPLFAQTPTLLISDDGTKWGVRLEDGRFLLYGKKFDNYTASQWLQRMGQPEIILSGPQSLPQEKGLSCEETICTFVSGGYRFMFLTENASEKETKDSCASAPDVLVYPLEATENCQAKNLIDEKQLALHGAHAITIGSKGLEIDSVRTRRGARPWSIGWEDR